MAKNDITVVITNYARTENLTAILDALVRQSVRPTVFAWDNSPAAELQDPRIDWLVHSSRNTMCATRWWMAAHAQTAFVLIHDDDLAVGDPAVLADTIERAAKVRTAVGAAGVVLDPERGYWEGEHLGFRTKAPPADRDVDILKGMYVCCPMPLPAAALDLRWDDEDDIAMSSALRRRIGAPLRVLSMLHGRLLSLPEGPDARKRRAQHRAARDAARWKYFRQR